MESRGGLRRVLEWIGGHERSVLVLGLLIVCGIWLFLAVADEVVEGDVQTLDERALQWLRDPAEPERPVGPVWLHEAARDITALGGVSVLLLVTGSVTVAFLLQRRTHAALLVAGSTVGGAILSTALKGFFDRDRPDVVPHLTEVITASFPSGHALLSAVVYLTLGALLARLASNLWAKAWCLLVALGITVLVGASRVFLGVHYPTDVVAGWAAGMAWALLCWLLASWLQRRGSVEG